MSTDTQKTFSLDPGTVQRLDALVPRYPQKRSAVLPVLHAVQAEQGYISNEAIEWVAQYLGLKPINVYEVVTFYPFFRQKPPGKKLVRVCRTLPCALNGSYKVCDTFKQEFGCGLDEVSPGGEVTIEFAECLASCGSGPVVMVDDDLHENVDEAKAKELCAKIKEEAKG